MVADVPADFEDGEMVKDQVVIVLEISACGQYFCLFPIDLFYYMIAWNVLEQSDNVVTNISIFQV